MQHTLEDPPEANLNVVQLQNAKSQHVYHLEGGCRDPPQNKRTKQNEAQHLRATSQRLIQTKQPQSTQIFGIRGPSVVLRKSHASGQKVITEKGLQVDCGNGCSRITGRIRPSLTPGLGTRRVVRSRTNGKDSPGSIVVIGEHTMYYNGRTD
ncbi:unnamed protein product [Protopolystoma xenopodis]|uniref:Uncharacterized protein n=1 Tax=Protopolystoma xenopodis TaxID=117903 RepID=A0A448WGC4_9PLAT|nr:unnamed protein product [Protopolystoma xenopodis]